MAKQLGETELRLSLILARERQVVRGRYSRLATAELNEILPRITKDFWADVQAGHLPDLDEYAVPIDTGIRL